MAPLRDDCVHACHNCKHAPFMPEHPYPQLCLIQLMHMRSNYSAFPGATLNVFLIMTSPHLSQQTSLFVGNLDVRVYRELLAEIFSLAGTVVQCHVVYDRTTGVSSGFGFVDYPDHETAKAAMEKFRGRSIYGQLLTIDWARASGPDAPAPNHCLFVGNLSPDITDEQLATAFSQFGTVASAKCAKDPATGKTQGFAFVAYQEKADAQSAMEAMNGQMLNNRSLRVDWAKGKASEDGSLPLDAIMAQTSINNVTAYVSGLRSETPEQAIRAVFEQFGPIREVRIPESIKNQGSETKYAFVRYVDHATAARAIFECQSGTEVEEKTVQVAWGRENARRAPPMQRNGFGGRYMGGFQQHQQQQSYGAYQQPYHHQQQHQSSGPQFGSGPPPYYHPSQHGRYR